MKHKYKPTGVPEGVLPSDRASENSCGFENCGLEGNVCYLTGKECPYKKSENTEEQFRKYRSWN